MIDADLQELIRKAESHSGVQTNSVTADTAAIRALLRVDGEFFIEFFLAEQLDMPVPAFHKEIWSLLTDQEKEKVLLAIPRDHAKTTLAKLVIIWYYLFTDHRFAVYLSNTNAIAKGACKDIVEFLSNPNFVAVFGQVNMVKSSENESLWIFDLRMPNGRLKRCILRAVGQGQQMRGINIDNQRPDIAVVDDVEDNENTDSEMLQKKLDRWIFGPFLKALARKKKVLWLGNMLNKKSLLARLSKNPSWNPVVFGALVKNAITGVLEPLWPGKWSVKALQEDFREYRLLGLIESWMCEMMNMPGHGENGLDVNLINYQPIPTPDQCLATFITVDPAFGEGSHNDESAVCVHAIVEIGPPITVAVSHGKWNERRLFDEILALAYYWNAWTWGVESIAAQRVLIKLFRLLLASIGIVNQVEILPLGAGSKQPKISRIRSWLALMGEKDWAIGEGDVALTTQVAEFDVLSKKNEDDRIDAAAYGPAMMDNYLNLILAQAQTRESIAPATARYGMELCDV